ncbi:MAG: CapA family protein [Dehalococcoidia bacterium]
MSRHQPRDAARAPLTLALAGDVMLGRLVNDRLRTRGATHVWDPRLLQAMRRADLRLVNLECALTASSERWHDGGEKIFSFRADPGPAIEALELAGIDFASNANNHACDYGPRGLIDTVEALDRAGIAHAGAGADLDRARAPAMLEAAGQRVVVSAWADYPMQWGATDRDPGINYTEVSTALDDFTVVADALREARALGDLVIFCIHWGPNMRERPTALFREFAHAVIDAGADVFWGHSAHVMHGIEFSNGRPILYDTGDFVDDYMVDPRLRNDLSALFLLRAVAGVVSEVEVLPTRIEDARARLATGADRRRVVQRMTSLCRELGTVVEERSGRIVVVPDRPGA